MAKKRASKKSANAGNSESSVTKVDKEMKSVGLSHKKILGLIVLLIGLVLVILNISAAIQSIVGFVLVYVGLWLFGYKVSLGHMMGGASS